MKAKRLLIPFSCFWLALGGSALGQIGSDAVLVRVEDNVQQVRVEAMDSETGRWLAIASGYRDTADSGWLKIALPEEYGQAQLRVLGSAAPSPFAGKVQNSMVPDAAYVDYPPTDYRNYGPEVDAGGGAPKEEPVIEEADIWAWQDSTLYFYNQYRGLQVVDMTDTLAPAWLDYYRYPAKGEDLYAMEGGRIILIGTGSYWGGEKLALQFLQFDGTALSLADTVELEAGCYMDSRRYNDFLYVMTREWVEEINPDGEMRNAPLIRLYTISLAQGVQDRVVDVQTFEGDGYLDAVLTAQPDGILLSLNKWYHSSLDWRYRWRSEVHVLVPGENGIPEEVGVARLSGILHDKFKMNFNDGLLTTISQQADWSTGQFSRATKLENFLLGEDGFAKIGSLDLAPGETLFASRFYGDTVYIVTFLFVDPLFSIDNSNPTHPVVAGELEVPGWSNYIEWVDDKLFAVGVEERNLTVSIFDVADPANMSLRDRVFLGEDSWAWSEAQYDDQAISFFPESRLLMLPFTSWSWESGAQIQAMQLITWDEEDQLQLRGQIQHIDVPRRGDLKENTVITVSGREVVTTDVTDPDVPVEGGSATLAWNVQHLIPHGDYWLQLESPESLYGYWYWRYPYDPTEMADPVLYVTSKAEPNIPAAEVALASGRLIGVAHEGDRLVLLQDVTPAAPAEYWQIPEKQSLVVRVYDLADPMAPALLDEKTLEGVPYMGGSFAGHLLADGSVLWASKYTQNNYIYMLDMAIWPGPWYYQTTLSYLVSTISPEGMVDIPAYKSYPVQDFWNQSSGWFWEEPLLVASVTEYIEHERPEKYPNYEARSRLLALDFSDPASPLELPRAKLPGNLVAVDSLPDGLNHYLYFEPHWNTLEVWGWDKATAFPLFKQVLYPDDTTETHEYTYSYAWMAPFHLRSRYHYNNGQSKSFLDVWLHAREANRFKRIEVYTLENGWFANRAVMEPFYLQSTYDTVMIFKGDAAAGTFDLLHELDLPFPNIYSLSLEASVMTEDALHIPAGMYGVETLPWETAPEEGPLRDSGYLATATASTDWALLPGTSWQRVKRTTTDAAGIMERMQWLYHADTMQEPDPKATDAGDLWRDSDWFGWYAHHAAKPRWISHLEHGELYLSVPEQAEASGFYLHDLDFGYLWTREDIYPFLYSFLDERWIHYVKGTGNTGRRWFFDFTEGWFGVDR
ncbi:MAG: beta-propeller domain-containing protein [Oceanipulchritudo sp.]